MGVSLSYITTAAVPAKARTAILEDAEGVNLGREWWCESINFFTDKKRPKHLIGDTKLFFAGMYSDPDAEDGLMEVDTDDDNFMAFRDAAFILQQLMRWSKAHGVDWTLEMAGGDLGKITKGKLKPAGLFGCDKAETKADEKKAAKLHKKYASRNS
jgi:hypothetical protein